MGGGAEVSWLLSYILQAIRNIPQVHMTSRLSAPASNRPSDRSTAAGKLLISDHIQTDFLSKCCGPVGSTHDVLKPLVQAPAWGKTTLTYFVVFLSPSEQILI